MVRISSARLVSAKKLKNPETNNARPAVGTPTPTKKDPAEQQVHDNSTYDCETVFVLLPCCAQVIRFILLC